MTFTAITRPAPVAVPVLLIVMGAAAPALAAPAGPAHRGPAVQAPLTAAQARQLSRHVNDKVIVLLKNQFRGLPDTPSDSARRAAAVRALQRPIRSELAATGATHVHGLTLIDAVTATVSRGEASRLAANPAVARVYQDLPIPVAANPGVRSAARPSALKPLPGACEPKGGVQLDPEAIEAINAAAQPSRLNTSEGLGITGAGVKVAFIADGVDPKNPDFIRANGKPVFVDYQDFSGTGTAAPTDGGEAFLDASSIAAQGRHTYNVATYGTPLSEKCNIRILGVAPGASLVGLNVFGSSNFAFNSVFLEAVNYAVTKDHVQVINESFGANPFPDTGSLDLTTMADDAAVKAGVTVVVSSGDAGPTNTIGSPATDPNLLSAGATTTYRAYAQTGIGGITAPGVRGWLDDNISGLSSGGFDQAGGTVDVSAPGDLNWALCTPDPKRFSACTNFAGKPAAVELAGGTSEAAPLTAGVAALVIQAYAKTHKGKMPSPAIVKQIIMSTAENIDAPAEQQGAGMVDAYLAVKAAEAYSLNGVLPVITGRGLIHGTTQFSAVAAPGTVQHFTEKLTNVSHADTTVKLTSRTLGPYTPIVTSTLTLTSAHNYAEPVRFTVPPGRARLNVSVALRGLVNLSLIDPRGNLAEYNLPQGFGNYGNAQVADPLAGTWTALVSGVPGSGTPKTITAHFQASAASWQAFGALSMPSMGLGPGESGTFTLTVKTPAQPGDESGIIIVHSSAPVPLYAHTTSIPVTLRSLVPAPAPAVTFTGTLTGGNGRGTSTGQTAYYQLQVPPGLQALNVSVNTGDPANTLLAELVDPSGEAASAATSGLLAHSPSGNTEIVPETGAQLHVLNPAAGLWTLVIDFYNAVSGAAVSQPFTVSMNDTPVSVAQSGLPTAGEFLEPGVPQEVDITVTNNGSTPEAYFIDARTDGSVTDKLASQTTGTVRLPNLAGVVPTFLVPSHTTAIDTQVTAKAPVFFDFSWLLGDPDLISSTGLHATGKLAAPDIPAGDWTITPFLRGPTGVKPAKPVPAEASMTATTAGFSPAFVSPTGDLWLGGTGVAAGFTPYVVNPGESVTIPVVLTPEGAVNTVFSGTLYVADSSVSPGAVTSNGLAGQFLDGSDIAAFPYSYTINGP